MDMIIRLYMPEGITLPDGLASIDLATGLRLLPARSEPVFDFPALVRIRAVLLDTNLPMTMQGTIDFVGGPAATSPDMPLHVAITLVDGEAVSAQIETHVPATHFETLTTWCPEVVELSEDTPH